jgi:hypothetical protein
MIVFTFQVAKVIDRREQKKSCRCFFSKTGATP